MSSFHQGTWLDLGAAASMPARRGSDAPSNGPAGEPPASADDTRKMPALYPDLFALALLDGGGTVGEREPLQLDPQRPLVTRRETLSYPRSSEPTRPPVTKSPYAAQRCEG